MKVVFDWPIEGSLAIPRMASKVNDVLDCTSDLVQRTIAKCIQSKRGGQSLWVFTHPVVGRQVKALTNNDWALLRISSSSTIPSTLFSRLLTTRHEWSRK